MNWAYLLTSIEGRISRKPFWIALLVFIALEFAAYVAVGERWSSIVSPLLAYPEFAVFAKRGHDRDAPTWIPGVGFAAVRLTPSASTHAGKECGGIRITLTNRRALSTTRLGFEIATWLRDKCGESWDSKRFPELLGSDALLTKFEAGATASELEAFCQVGLAGYAKRRVKFLLYPEPAKK